ncbi:DNA-3-methyladenine glycosylase family protein [Flavobacterium dankookense]|uniref:DNA-3-methyladenine glycosylase II n=1 Tax=Flavobacterium dankookense TaxID=706186 RepID=A0A4R6Q904_9FLAO|nr:DNA-3-methyladenine glycosylase [Flavobacterium dankookense]TDP58625.1 DNA-3-methyladenine glycosylase II [Flavobacterium dankookense]
MKEAISFLVEKDQVFKKLYEQYGNPFIPSRPEGFQTLCKLILEQQVSIESARACYQKLEHFLEEVTPTTISIISIEELRNCSVSRQKAVYLKALSDAILNESLILETLSQKSDDEVRKELIKIKGIGNWTIDVYLLFSLQSEDIIPLGDIAVINTIKELFGSKTPEEIAALSENWKPYRSMATFFLWHHYLEKRNRKPIV